MYEMKLSKDSTDNTRNGKMLKKTGRFLLFQVEKRPELNICQICWHNFVAFFIRF